MPAEKTKEPTLLERMHESRGKDWTAWSDFVTAREKVEQDFEARVASDSKPTAEEVTLFTEGRAAYQAQAAQLRAAVTDWDARISDQETIERERDAAAEGSKQSLSVSIEHEPKTYERFKALGENGISYYRDLAAQVDGLAIQGANKDEARKRLDRHADEMSKEAPKRAKAARERAAKQVEDADRANLMRYDSDPFKRGNVRNTVDLGIGPSLFGAEQRAEPNLTQGQGGYFVPPLWLIDDYIPYLRAHRVAAGLPRQMDLPEGTDTINIPKLANPTVVGYQQMNNAGLPSQDWTDTSVTANVKTIGGYSDVAIQLLEQSPHQIVDEVVTTDLMAAYNTFLDAQVIAGDGLNTGSLNGGHILGLYPTTNWSSTNAITYTASSPAPYTFPMVFGAMASQISRTRFDASNLKFVLHGRRWFWYSTGLDSNDRPLGETDAGGPFNIAAAIDAGLHAEGLVGMLPSVANAPVYIDMNIPTNDNAGTPLTGTDDIAIGALWDDVWLFEGALRTNVYREILSGSLGVRFQLYNYAAMLVRYGQSLAVATGTGFSAPASASTSSVLF
jgi:hypothetical protein